MVNDRVNYMKSVLLLRHTDALQIDYVFCMLLKFPFSFTFYFQNGWGD